MANNTTHENLVSKENYYDHSTEEDEETLPPFSNLCCCLQGRYLRRAARDDVSRRHLLLQQQEEEGGDRLIVVVEDENWLVKSAKKLKEVSEVLAGPKWKNLIRRLSKWGVITYKKKRSRFQYDPQSYALNFNDGIDKELIS